MVCEEFHCVPSVGARELDRDAELVLEVMELRAYARAKAIYDRFDRMEPQERTRLSQDPLIQRVQLTEFALMQRQRHE